MNMRENDQLLRNSEEASKQGNDGIIEVPNQKCVFEEKYLFTL